MIKELYEIFLKNDAKLIHYNDKYYFYSKYIIFFIKYKNKKNYNDFYYKLSKYGQFQPASKEEIERIDGI